MAEYQLIDNNCPLRGRIISLLKYSEPMSFSELKQFGASNKSEKKKLTAVIWTLAANGFIQADWSKKFDKSTELWIPLDL